MIYPSRSGSSRVTTTNRQNKGVKRNPVVPISKVNPEHDDEHASTIVTYILCVEPLCPVSGRRVKVNPGIS